VAIKFNCSTPECGQRLAVEDSLAGTTVCCPACKKAIKVPSSSGIKFACAGCGQNVVVEAYEAGRFVKCPSCQKLLQIPGASAKSPFKGPPAEKKVQEFTAGHYVVKRRRYFPGWLTRLSLGWGIGALTALALHLISSFLVHRDLQTLAKQIYFHDIQYAPLPKKDAKYVFYAQTLWDRIDIYRLNKETLEAKLVDRINGRLGPRDFFWIGWSPDEKNIAYSVKDADRHAALVVLHDRFADVVKTSYNVSSLGQVEQGVWVNSGSMVLFGFSEVHAVFNIEANEKWGALGRKGLVELPALAGSKLHWLAADSDHSFVAVGSRSPIMFDLEEGKAVPLSSAIHGNIAGIAYDPNNSNYLFSMEETNRRDYHAYEFGPRGDKRASLTRMTSEFATNATWIQQGGGIAYQGSNSLVIRTSDPSFRTNLFVNGVVRNYRIGPDGNEIYAVAADQYKLTGLWEYDIAHRSKANITPIANGNFKFVEPIRTETTNEYGERINFYYVPPASLDSSKKYPVVLDQNLANRYEQGVQFLVNSGIFYVSASDFGITDWEAAPLFENTMAVYRALSKIPNIDTNRIYISGTSKSTIVACELVDAHPEMWRGALLFSPSSLPRLPASGSKFPSVFISIGDQDVTGFRDKSEKYALDAAGSFLPTRLNYQHAPHIFPTPELMLSHIAAVKFILTGY